MTILERIKELMIGDDYDTADLKSFVFRWYEGPDGSAVESLHIENHHGGGSHYDGVFHPGDGFCVGNPCKFCGYTTYDY